MTFRGTALRAVKITIGALLLEFNPSTRRLGTASVVGFTSTPPLQLLTAVSPIKSLN